MMIDESGADLGPIPIENLVAKMDAHDTVIHYSNVLGLTAWARISFEWLLTACEPYQ